MDESGGGSAGGLLIGGGVECVHGDGGNSAWYFEMNENERGVGFSHELLIGGGVGCARRQRWTWHAMKQREELIAASLIGA
eukprot:570066-Pelagomonas_calceolata.AAC.5